MRIRPALILAALLGATLTTGCEVNRALNEEFGPKPTATEGVPQASGSTVDSPTNATPAEAAATEAIADPFEACRQTTSSAAQICCESWRELMIFSKESTIDTERTMERMAPMVRAAGQGVVSTMAENPTAEIVQYARPWLPPAQEWNAASEQMRELFKDCFGGPAEDAAHPQTNPSTTPTNP